MSARILIVDDDENNRELLEIMLTPEGYRITTAESGEQALTAALAEAPDLILLDVMMPGMDGYQVVTELKAHAATKNIPVILLTAADAQQVRAQAQSVGAEGYLHKPVGRTELCLRVRTLLALHPKSVRD